MNVRELATWGLLGVGAGLLVLGLGSGCVPGLPGTGDNGNGNVANTNTVDNDNTEDNDNDSEGNENENTEVNENVEENDNVETNDNGVGGLDGAALYAANCAVCHGDDGSGGAFGSVIGTSVQENTDALAQVPAMGAIELTEDEIAAIVEFLAQ